MIPPPFKKWLAFGGGIGIQIAGPRGSESLRISAVRVRPNGAKLLGELDVEDFPHRAAGTWGTDYAAFLAKFGLRHVPTNVVLPRQDVIVRPISLPGVSDKDLEGAVRFQMDGLHPYEEEDVFSSWTRLSGTSTVLVAVARREAVERYAAAFAEAGIKIRAFTCSAAAVYSGLRLFGAPLSKEILAFDDSASPAEFYGESSSRAVLSASFECEPARAAAMAASELRLDPQTEPRPLASLFKIESGSAAAIPYAAALASACPLLSLPLNLLPAERRQTSSPLRWIPSAALGAVVLLLAGALAAFPGFENRRYLRTLDAQIAQVAPQAQRAAEIDKEIQDVRLRTQLLDDLRRRPKADMDALAELTKLLPPPTWLNYTEISGQQVIIGGQTDQAEPLLKVLDASPLFESSEFQAPPSRMLTGWMFRIKTNREGMLAPPTPRGAARP